MRRTNMSQIVLLICALLNMFTNATEEVRMDWFDDLDQRDKDNAAQLLSQGIQHYNGLHQDLLMDMETKFGIMPAQTQQLYEFLYSTKNEKKIDEEPNHSLIAKMLRMRAKENLREKKIDEELNHNLIAETLTNIYTRAKENLINEAKLSPCSVFKEEKEVEKQKIDSETLARRARRERLFGNGVQHSDDEDEKVETSKIPYKCDVCYEDFPVSLQFPCRHEICAFCTDYIMALKINKSCPLCRGPLPKNVSELLPMINIYPNQITPDIHIEKLQSAFPLICSEVPNLRRLAKCINMGIDVNTKGFFGYFPLHFASQKSVVKYLVNKGADVNQTGSAGWTPLHMSAKDGNLPVVQHLVENGAKINQATDNGATPLFMSAQKGHLPVVQYLVENGAKMNQARDDGASPLFVSSQKKLLPIVQYLVNEGADVNQTDNDGWTALHVSSQEDLPVLQYLVDNGANINQTEKTGATPLFMAAQEGLLPIVQYLVEKKANINQDKNNGVTPLFMSSQNNHLTVVQYLVQKGADVNQAKKDGATPLFVSSQLGLLSIVQCLVENEANINQAKEDGTTPLHVSSKKGHLPVVEYLIQNGSDINHTAKNGATPLGIAIFNKQSKVARFLLRKKANVESTKLYFQKNELSDLIEILDKLCQEIKEY